MEIKVFNMKQPDLNTWLILIVFLESTNKIN